MHRGDSPALLLQALAPGQFMYKTDTAVLALLAKDAYLQQTGPSFDTGMVTIVLIRTVVTHVGLPELVEPSHLLQDGVLDFGQHLPGAFPSHHLLSQVR
jgi:hypothetical protein